MSVKIFKVQKIDDGAAVRSSLSSRTWLPDCFREPCSVRVENAEDEYAPGIARVRMIDMRLALAVLTAVIALHPQPFQAQELPGSATQNIERIGSLEALTLHRGRTGDGKRPQFLSVTLLPKRAKDGFQIAADIPGHGETQLIALISL